MRTLLFLPALLACLSTTALAADLTPQPTDQPAPALWTGFHIGVNAGGAWSNPGAGNNATWPVGTETRAALRVPGSFTSLNNEGTSGGWTGFIGGGQIGYDWRLPISNVGIVAGLEADIQGIAASNGGATSLTPFRGRFPQDSGLSYVQTSSSLNFIGTARARIGYLVTPTLLVYGTGGFAYGDVSFSKNTYQSFYAQALRGIAYNAFGNFSNSGLQTGYAAGGGAEWMFQPNWSAKVEYLYYDLGSVTGSADMIAYPTRINVLTSPYLWMTNTVNARINGNLVRAGVNYHFNWGAAPVVAAY